jgi:hypothetical protein
MPTSPGGFTAGDVLAAADMNALPGGVVAISEGTSNQNINANGPTDLNNCSVTFTAVAGRRYKITGQVGVSGVYNNARWIGWIYEGANQVGRIGSMEGNDSSNNDIQTWHGCVTRTPSAGSITYKLAIERTAGTDPATFLGASSNPRFIVVEDIGPA